MDDNAVHALNMAFAVMVFVIALSLAMFMFSQLTATAEVLTFYADSTAYYDNIKIADPNLDDQDIKSGTARVVNAETIIPTLYRYYKENFCVKIYDANDNLIQIFDINLEGKVNNSLGDTNAKLERNSTESANYAYQKLYNDKDQKYYLFGAPWLGSTESMKKRVDYFINGTSGYINNTFVDYKNNLFYQARMEKIQFKENFINYNYTGETMETEDGDTLVTGASAKDKIVINYKMLENP